MSLADAAPGQVLTLFDFVKRSRIVCEFGGSCTLQKRIASLRPANFRLTFRAAFWKIFPLSHPPETPMFSLPTSRARRLFPILLLISMFFGCGQKGDLRLPDEDAAALAPAPGPG